MNLLLFANEDALRHIRPGDPRLAHIRQVLKAGVGGQIYVGVQGGCRAWAKILSDSTEDGMRLCPQWETLPPPAPLPLRIIVGLPRPQTARRILFDAAALGVAALDFFLPQKGEPSYAQSSLWQSDEWRQRLLQGAEQACVTMLPQVRHFSSLAEAAATPENGTPSSAIPQMPLPPVSANSAASSPASTTRTHTLSQEAPLHEIRLALDIYEAVAPLSRLLPPGLAEGRVITLAIGSERGWSAAERDTLRNSDFILTHIGTRVLRTETALVSAIALAADKLLVAQET